MFLVGVSCSSDLHDVQTVHIFASLCRDRLKTQISQVIRFRDTQRQPEWYTLFDHVSRTRDTSRPASAVNLTWLMRSALMATLLGSSFQNNVEYVAVRAGQDEAATPAKLVQNYVVCTLDRKLDVLLGFIKSHLKSKMIIFFTSCAQARTPFAHGHAVLILGRPLICTDCTRGSAE